jgi:hypothetical protein
MAEPFAPTSLDQQKRNWTPIIIGAVVVAVVVAALAIFGRTPAPVTPQEDPYAAKLQVSDAQLEGLENFVGGTVNNLDFKLTNAGDRTVSGAHVQLAFKNQLGEVTQTETVPVRAVEPNQLGGYPDQVELSKSPIAPGQSKNIRITLEHISAEWDRNVPEMKFVNIRYK